MRTLSLYLVVAILPPPFRFKKKTKHFLNNSFFTLRDKHVSVVASSCIYIFVLYKKEDIERHHNNKNLNISKLHISC